MSAVRSAALTLIAVLCACAPRGGEIALPAEAPQAFSPSGAEAVPERWWTAFGDAELDRLVDEALRENFGLATAWERFREARAIVDREGAPLWPTLDAVAEGEVRRPAEGEGESVLLGLTAQYEVDLWGRIRSSVDAERYRARATLADYRTVALSLSAEVVATWYRMIEARSQLELLDEQIAANEQVLRLLRERFGSGQIRSVDILRQQRLLEATREQRIAVESALAVLEHQLAVLLGRPPRAGVEVDRAGLPVPPPVPAAGLPSELVRRRPDVQRAYALLLAADRDMAAAIANRYPRLSLSASLATAHSSADDLFRDWFASLAANLLAPLFDGGARAAEVDRTRAVKRQRLYAYGETALIAFREVEDALVQERKQQQRIESLEAQVELAQKTYEQLRLEYFNGLADYIDVLTALTDEQVLRRELLTARRVLLELRVALYRALAGGFGTPRETE